MWEWFGFLQLENLGSGSVDVSMPVSLAVNRVTASELVRTPLRIPLIFIEKLPPNPTKSKF